VLVKVVYKQYTVLSSPCPEQNNACAINRTCNENFTMWSAMQLPFIN